MKDIECPYCDEWQDINHDDGYGYAEDDTFEQECSDCEKTFAFTTSIIFNYEANKADCLNDGEHKFKPNMSSHYPDSKYCEDCGLLEKGKIVWPTQ